jgi:hypothetical protein
VKYAVAFGRFWYDFIVGDSVLLAVGGVLAVLFAWAMVQFDASPIAEFLIPAIVIATLWVSLPRRKH